MRNVTITLDDEVARWVRVLAARHETSVSRLVGEILRDRMQTEEGYRSAMGRFFSVRPRPLREQETDRHASREELHDRPGLR